MELLQRGGDYKKKREVTGVEKRAEKNIVRFEIERNEAQHKQCGDQPEQCSL